MFARKSFMRWLSLVLTSLLLISTPSLAYGEVLLVPQNWVTPETGYFLSEIDGRDLLAALQTYRIQNETLTQAYEDLHVEYQNTAEQYQQDLQRLEKAINADLTRQFVKTTVIIIVVAGVVYMIAR